MDYYFLIISAIDIFVLGTMCVLTGLNETLNMKQRRWFISSFILIIVITALEVVTEFTDNGSASLRWISIVSNYLGFGLSPAVAIMLASVFKNRSTRYALTAELVYMVLLAVSIPFGTIFYIDEENQYLRGDFFGIYPVVYFISVIYLIAVTVVVAGKYQNKSRNALFLIAAFMLACTMIQIFFPQIHVSWLCVSLLSILYFIYCNGMWQQLDELTGLLNQKSYLNKTASLSGDVTLVVFDVDDFKQVNDNHGHLTGDQCLKEVADCIKDAYSRYGLCYRIGGDEFCVLLDPEADAEKCYRKLIQELNVRRQGMELLPYVSVGSASYAKGDDILSVKENADNDMYRFKKAHKETM